MPKFDADTLYELLPAIYRIRDAEHGDALWQLVEILAEQGGVVERDIAELYDNWFIETCQEWVVPYIGDLVGARNLLPIDAGLEFSQRARVANTIAYRRRKGTAPMLEQLARDTTSWNARAVEFFELLKTTQHFNHVRPHNAACPDLRDTAALELLETAFDTVAHTVDVRSIASGRGRHNIPNVGLYLWRLQAYPVSESVARPLGDGSRRYTFNPLGFNAPLFNRPRTEREITHLATELNVPGVLRRRPLYEELEAVRQADVDACDPVLEYFESSGIGPVVQFRFEGEPDPIPVEKVLVCNLEDVDAAPGEESEWGEKPDPLRDWRVPPALKQYQLPQELRPPDSAQREIALAFDPRLGRIALPALAAPPAEPPQIRVSYAYGFSADVGGGPYPRFESVGAGVPPQPDWTVGVTQDLDLVDGEHYFSSLGGALAQWDAKPAGSSGVIAILDSSTYAAPAAAIQIPTGSRLAIVAARWQGPGTASVSPDEVNPHLRGPVSVNGAAAGSTNPGQLFIDGLLLEGALDVAGSLGKLTISHCTLLPESGPSVHGDLGDLRLEISRSICRGIDIGKSPAQLQIGESIIMPAGAADSPAIEARDAANVSVDTCTVLGTVNAARFDASNSIFAAGVFVRRQQQGCVRFSFVPDGSRTPRRYRCQPDLALAAALEEKQGDPPDPDISLSAAERKAIIARMVPSFTSERYGHPGFCQLGRHIPQEIFTGADDGSEMGVFSILKQAQRVANLRASLGDYLPLGLEAGLFFAT